jgi:hypothetical protein
MEKIKQKALFLFYNGGMLRVLEMGDDLESEEEMEGAAESVEEALVGNNCSPIHSANL